MTTLILYFSRTGTCRTIAGILATRLQADVEEIRCRHFGSGFINYWNTIIDSLADRLPLIEPLARDPSHYDLVVIGGPLWTGRPSTPLRAVLKAHKGRLPALAFFLSHGGSPAGSALREMAKLAGAEPKATLVLREADVKKARAGDAIDRFVAQIQSPSINRAA